MKKQWRQELSDEELTTLHNTLRQFHLLPMDQTPTPESNLIVTLRNILDEREQAFDKIRMSCGD